MPVRVSYLYEKILAVKAPKTVSQGKDAVNSSGQHNASEINVLQASC